MLDKFANFCNPLRIKVGDEFKVIDLERDPFYSQMPEEYRKQLLREIELCNEFDFNKSLFDLQLQITDYFAGEYTETNDEEFQEIWKKFFYEWFWGEIWICYSPELLEKEINSWEDRLDINKYRAHWKCPYRLFKLVKRISQTRAVYASVFTGIHYEINEKEIPMIWASCNEGLNWRQWRFLLSEFLAGEQYFIKTQKLAGKRIMRDIKNPDNIKREDANLQCVSVIFDINATEAAMKNKYTPFDACNPEIPRGIWDNLLNWFMTKAGWLGYIQNMNDKKERLTTGENFKDLHGATNVQINNLKELNRFAKDFEKEYPNKKLNFNVSNWGEAQGIPIGELEGEEIDNIRGNEEGEDV